MDRHAATIEALRARDILVPGSGVLPLATVTAARRSALDTVAVTTDALTLPAVAAGLLCAKLGLRARGLSAMLDAARARGHRTPVPCVRTIALAQAWARQRRRLPLTQVCLLDALALHRLLARAGLSATLVIGVRLAPFAAHCWLQSADMVLTDTCDAVAPYVPILAL